MDSRYRIMLAPMAAICLSAIGCASVDPAADYDRARQSILEATGSSDAHSPGDDEAANAAIRELLVREINCDDAVRISLINNPRLRAAFFDVGMARADLVQSGLFSNPTLALSIAFPDGGGRSNIQGTFAQNIVDLWQIPIRKRVSEQLLDAAVLEVARLAVQLAVDTRGSFFSAVAADRLAAIARENVAIARELFDIAETRRQAGAVGNLDVNLAQGAVFSAELELERSRLEAASARRRLATLLGILDEAETLKLSSAPFTSMTLPLDANQVVNYALANRLDVQIAQLQVEADRRRVRLEIAKVLPDLSIGVYNERTEQRALPARNILGDTARASVAAGGLTAPDVQSRDQRSEERGKEIENIIGPAFSLTIPIFDQNQAQIARAKLAYEQSAMKLDALQREITQAVRQGVDQAETSRRVRSYFSEKLLPQAQSNLELSRQSYLAGRASLIVMLDAQRVFLAARRDSIIAERESAVALAELERLTARPLARIADSSSSASQPIARVEPQPAAVPTQLPGGSR